MTGRYIVKTQNDYFNVTDTYNNVPIVNGIRTEIEAEWLADHINTLNDEKDIITDDYTDLQEKYDELETNWLRLSTVFSTIYTENVDLKKENKGLKEQIKEFKRMPLLNMTNINKKLLEEIRHELVCTHGLYAYDSKYDEDAIHLNFKDLIEKIDDELEKEKESE